MIHLSKVFSSLLGLLLCVGTVYAGNDIFHTELRGSDIALTNQVHAKDAWYDYMQTNSNWYDYNGGELDYTKRFVNFNATGRVSLKYDGTEHLVYSTPWELIVSYHVRAYGANGALLEEKDDNLTLSYDPAYNSTQVDVAVMEYPGAHRLSIEITHICGQPNGQIILADDFILEGSIEVERYFTLNYNEVLSCSHRILNDNPTGKNTTIKFFWEFTEGAEEYELQYVYVSDELIDGQSPQDRIDFRKATRILTPFQDFRLIPAFQTGSIFYRVRPIGRHGSNFKFTQLGEWSSTDEITLDDYLNNGADILAFEKDMNWLHRISYSDDGRHSEAVTFYDGLRIARQSVNRDNENKLATIQETIMDHEGRPTVNVLPTPFLPDEMDGSNLEVESHLRYYNNYSIANGTNTQFNKSHFDLDSNRDNPLGLKATSTEKAGSYFSSANPLKDYSHNRFLADGLTTGNGAYYYTRVIYDDQGRVKEQSGIGTEYRMGTDHTTQMFYGTPSQRKLDRLFGTEVGYAEHYRKLMVKDPNGQLTVSYEKLDGKIIATALVGYTPTTTVNGTALPLLDEVSIADGIIGNLTEDLTNHNEFNAGNQEWELVYTKLVSTPGPYDFHYDLNLTAAEYGINCGSNAFNHGCEYLLDIRLLDPDGNLVSFTGNFNVLVLDVNGDLVSSVNQNSFPVEVSYGTDYDLDFTAIFGDVGNYTISKTLGLKGVADAIAAYSDFINNPSNGCVSPTTIVSDCEGPDYVIDATFTPGNGTDCASLLDVFKSDMSPGGQYFDNLVNGVSDPATINNWLQKVNYNGPNVLAPDNSQPLGGDFDGLKTILNDAGENVYFSNAAQGWNAFREYWDWPEVQDHLFGTGTGEWGLQRYHPEYGHYEWCIDINSNVSGGGQANADFNLSLTTYSSSFNSWISQLQGSNCPSQSVNYQIVNADPYFSSSMGTRPVNGDGLNGKELMRELLCTYPEEPSQNNTMWESAVLAANQQNGGSSTTAQRWEIFANFYLQQKNRVISLQKKNPCDSDKYSPFLYDESSTDNPADMVADLPRDNAFNYWGNSTYDLGGGTMPSNGLHPVYDNWHQSCGVQTSSIPKVSELLNDWGFNENEQLRVMDERSAGFMIRIPDMVQVAQDLVDDGMNDGIFGENDDWDELGDMINSANPCIGGASAMLPYGEPVSGSGGSNSFTQNSTVGFPASGTDIAAGLAKRLYFQNPRGCTPLNSNPSTCLSLVDGTIYHSNEDFYFANQDFFDCLVGTVNNYVSSPWDFEATHTPTHLIISSPSHAEFIPNGTYITTYSNCNCNIGLDGGSTSTSELDRSIEGQSFGGEGATSANAANTSQVILGCYPFWNPCDQNIPHCLCEDLSAAAQASSTGMIPEIAGLYAAEYGGGNLNDWETFLTELSTQCFGFIYNSSYTDEEREEAIDLIEDLADGVVDLPTSPNKPSPIPLDCFTLEPDPCDEGQTIADFHSSAAYQDALNALLADFAVNYPAACMSSTQAPDALEMEYEDREYHFTLYYYSPEGNLYATVPPEGVRPIPETDQAVFTQIATKRANGWGAGYEVPEHRRNAGRDDQLMTVNYYNSFNNPQRTKNPDHESYSTAADGYKNYGETEYMYDDLGRLRFTRDPQQSSDAKVLYTKYDEQGRLIETGLLYWPASFVLLQQYANDINFPLASIYTLDQITKTYYDEVVGYSPGTQSNLRNRISKKVFFEQESAAAHATYYSYDIRANIKTLWQEDFNVINTNGFRKRIDFDFNEVSGFLKKVYYQKGQPDAYTHQYCYDNQNRLTRVLTSGGGGIWEEDQRLFYRLDGPIARREVGDYKVQGLDYAYTLQGWMKGINSSTLRENRDMGNDGALSTGDNFNKLHRWMGRDAYGMALYYHTGDYQSIENFTQSEHFYTNLPSQNGVNYDAFDGALITGLFSGNITAQQTALTGENGLQMDYVLKGYRYDQMSRMTKALTAIESASTGSGNTVYSNNFWDSDNDSTEDYLVELEYDRNGNITSLFRNGFADGAQPRAMDDLTYDLPNNSIGRVNNHLRGIFDVVPTGNYTQDVDNQSSNNYDYDRVGNLTQDLSQEIAEITWTLNRRVKEVIRTTGSIKPDLEYRYDSDGNRVEKIIKPKASNGTILSQTDWESTHYVLDAFGKVMAIYRKSYGVPQVDGSTVSNLPGITKYKDDLYIIASGSGNPVPNDPTGLPELSFTSGSGNYFGETIQLEEVELHGNARIGTDHKKQVVDLSLFSASINAQTRKFDNFNYWEEYDLHEIDESMLRVLGEKTYELTNHLGNVMEVVSDRLIAVANGATLDYYVADIRGATDYYPFGMPMPNRDYESSAKRYGYNGQENDEEWGPQSIQDYDFRMYNASIGRFLSIDPLAADFPSWSSYTYVNDNPISFIDPDGRNGILSIDKEAGTITVTANFHFSTNTSAAFTAAGRANNYVTDDSFLEHINDNWGFRDKTVEIDGKSYTVNYDINIVSHETHQEAIAAWKADPASNFMFVREDGRSSNYAADTQVLNLNARQQEKGDGKTYSHEVGHALGIGHNSYSDEKGVFSISSYKFNKRNVIQQDVLNTVTNAVQLANQTENNNVEVLLETATDTNTLTIQNSDGTSGQTATYPVPNGQKNE